MKKLDTYILHIVYPNGEIRHYVGATRHGRFYERLWEHRRARGALVTSHAARCGAQIEGAVIHTNAMAQAEAEYQALTPLDSLCPICSATSQARRNQDLETLPTNTRPEHVSQNTGSPSASSREEAAPPLRSSPPGDPSFTSRSPSTHGARS